jgi:antibiotic biosynthesis monooxygenase (ABM) superfamily enzyme
MAIVLLTVRATISADQEDAFNEWYNEEHCPQLLRFNGAVSARRYRSIMGEDKYQYMAVYEFKDEETFEAFQKSEEFADLISEYDRHWGGVSERHRSAYVQVFP